MITRRQPSRLVAFIALAALAMPATAAAQKNQFFDAMLPLYRALAGSYGDEGPQLTASVESMSAALARWDADVRDRENTLRARLRAADPPAAIQSHTLLASMYVERGRFADALREFDADIRLDPGRAAFFRFKALLRVALGRHAEAADAFRAAWRADPADPRNAYGLLTHPSPRTPRTELTRARDAMAALERAILQSAETKAESPFLSVRPIDDDTGGVMAFAPAAYAHAMTLLLNGQMDAGMTALRVAVAADPLLADPAVRLEPTRRGMAALRRGDIGEALEAMRAALALAPASSEAHRRLATAELIDGDVTAAIQHLREAVRLAPKNERAWLALARALDEGGDWIEAANVLRHAVAELPDSGELRWQLSVISGKRQQTDSADLELIASADRLVMLAGTGELYGRVARLAQAHLDYDRGLVLLQEAVALTPNNAKAHQALGRAYVDQGREDEGYAELAVALWLDPSDAETLTALGRLHLAAADYPFAIETLTRAVTLDAANAPSVHALGDALVRAGRIVEGQQRIEESERLQARAVEGQRRSRTAGMLSLQAELHMTQHEYDRAIDVWQQAVALEGRNASTHLRLAEAFIAAKRPDEAVTALQAAISLSAGPDAHRRLAEVYTALGRTADAARERRTYTEQRLQELSKR